MNFRRDKFVRFHDWSSDDGTFTTRVRPSLNAWSSDDGTFTTRVRPSLNAVKKGVRRVFEYGSEKIRSLKKPIIFGSLGKKQPRNDKVLGSKKLTLNSQEVFLQTWNKLFLLSCAFALAVDPLFLYIPVVDDDRKCLDLDDKLGIVVCVLRTFVELLFVPHCSFSSDF